MSILGSFLSRPMSVWLSAIGVILLVLAWWLLRPGTNRSYRAAALLLALWSVPLLIVPPALSADPFFYADLGWILHQDGNPYEVGLKGMGGPYASSIDTLWAGHGVPYPPLSLLASRFGIEIMGLHPYWGVIGQRVLALGGVVLLVIFLPRLSALFGVPRNWAEWLGLLNPLLVIHLIGGAHNDALMAGVAVFALWVAARGARCATLNLVLAPVLIGLAMGFKQQAGLLVVAAAGLPIMARLQQASRWHGVFMLGWRIVINAALALATFAAVSLASGLGFGWRMWLSELGRVGTLAPFFVLGYLCQAIMTLMGRNGQECYATTYYFVAWSCAIGLVWLLLAWTAQPMRIVAWGSLLVAFMGKGMRPWYLVLTLALLSVTRIGERSARLLVWTLAGYSVAYALQYNLSANPWQVIPIGIVCGMGLWIFHNTLGGNERLTAVLG
jgi:hypothetical protein